MGVLEPDDLRHVLADVVDALPEEEQAVITGLYWERASRRVLARRLGKSLTTIERLHVSALERLRGLTKEDL